MKLSLILLGLSFVVVYTTALPAKKSIEIETEVNLHDVERRAVATNSCLSALYVMAFTPGHRGAETGGEAASHAIEVVAKGEVRHLRLYDKPGEDQQLHKGDLWKFDIANFHFPDPCIFFEDIEKVYIIENSDDGWRIEAAVTLVKDSNGGVQVLTQNLDIDQSIDDGHHQVRRYELTFA